MKAKKFKFVYALIILAVFLFIDFTAHAGKIDYTTLKEKNHRTAPITHYDFDAWIYTKYDLITGYYQVYYQYMLSSYLLPAPLKEIQLTFDASDKIMPKWGPYDVGIDYYETSSASAVSCSAGATFFYLTDSDGDDIQQ